MIEGTETTTTVSRQTLEETPARALDLLRGVATNIAIRTALRARGYTQMVHDSGWRLLHLASGFEDPSHSMPADPGGEEASEAIKLLDDWDEDGIRIVTASLRHRHVAQAAFVLEGLKPATGIAAVVGVAKLLARLDALEKGKERSATRKADHAALATLDERGITKELRVKLQGLVDKAQVLGEALPEVPEAVVAREEAYMTTLRNLRVWYEEWADIARSTIKRRDHLITLGLAQRKKRKKQTAPE